MLGNVCCANLHATPQQGSLKLYNTRRVKEVIAVEASVRVYHASLKVQAHAFPEGQPGEVVLPIQLKIMMSYPAFVQTILRCLLVSYVLLRHYS